jgi:hypothetical protein
MGGSINSHIRTLSVRDFLIMHFSGAGHDPNARLLNTSKYLLFTSDRCILCVNILVKP